MEAALGSLDALQSQHRAVDVKTRSLHDACERLVTEKQRLMDFAEALRHKLHYFDELTHIAGIFRTWARPLTLRGLGGSQHTE